MLFLAVAPRRHSAQPNPVLDDVEQLAIREPLRVLFSHVRRGRIHLPAHVRLTAAVVRMAESAVVRPVGSRFRKHLARVWDWIALFLCARGNGGASSGLRKVLLQSGRLGASAESVSAGL